MKKLLGVLFVLGGTLQAQSTLPLTVQKAIELGLENSKALHASQMRANYADARASEVNAARFPALKFNGGITRLSDIPPSTIGPFPPILPVAVTVSQTILNNYNMKFSMTQPLFVGFRLDALSRAADFAAEAQNHDFSRDRAELIYNIKLAYWTYYKALQIQRVVNENVEQVKSHLNDVQRMMDQGMTTTNDVLKVQVQLSDVQLKQIDARNGVRMAMIGLNNTIGIPLSTEIVVDTAVVHQPKEFGDLTTLINRAMTARPEIKAMYSQVKAGEAGVTAARSGWYPQVFLAANYNYQRPNQRFFPAVDRFKDTWDVTLGVSLDIWNWGTTLHQTDQAQAQLAQALDGLGQVEDGVTLDLTQAFLNLQQAQERISVANQGVTQAEENNRVTTRRFSAGLASTSDMIDAEVALLAAKTNQTNAIVDYEIASARMEKSIGE
jgi:outer membrane protein